MSSSTRELRTPHRSPLQELHAVRNRYGEAERTRKLRCIQQLEQDPPRSARRLAAYHDDLLFLRAFPDDPEVLGSVRRALSRIARRVHGLGAAERRRLDDSGMAGTTTRHAFAFGIAQWLISQGEEVELDWHSIDVPERLDPLLRLTMAQAESDAFDSGELTTRDWLALATGKEHKSLAWLTRAASCEDACAAGAPDPATIRLLYESLELPVRWRLTTATSTTGNMIDSEAITFRHAMRRLPVDPVAHVNLPLETIERLDAASASIWLAAARAALAARCREVHAISYANLDEIYRADLGEGASLVLIGATPSDRLTLEANYGYVIFSNGVPVGYGGVTPLAAQANTGVNIFDPFRRAEGPMLFLQALRAFRSLFGVRRFIVNPFQFGAGNDEALASGAFWMYDRLGFRSTKSELRALADRERERLAARPEYRTSVATLRRLAASDVVLELESDEAPPLFEERWLVRVARAVTESLASPDIWTRLARRDDVVRGVERALGVAYPSARACGLGFGMERLAPVVALVLDDVSRWSFDERAALVHLLSAKGAPQERDFAIASRDHHALWNALRNYCMRDEQRA